MKKYQVIEDATRKLKTFQLIKTFANTLCCHLLNVASCINPFQPSVTLPNHLETLENITGLKSVYSLPHVTYFNEAFNRSKAGKKTGTSYMCK